jgi:predicted YcjX-like family ATPase
MEIEDFQHAGELRFPSLAGFTLKGLQTIGLFPGDTPRQQNRQSYKSIGSRYLYNFCEGKISSWQRCKGNNPSDARSQR